MTCGTLHKESRPLNKGAHFHLLSSQTVKDKQMHISIAIVYAKSGPIPRT